MHQQQETGKGFEDEVRRIARLLWPTPTFQGAEIHNGRERDAFIRTDDAIHIIEATILRTKDKAESDISKTADLVTSLRREHPEKIVKGWFITRDDLTADQMTVASKYTRKVTALPFKDFLSKLVDARSYLTFREKISFGSVADPINNHFEVPRDTYIPSFFLDEINGHTFDFNQFFDKSCENGARTILLGDFGVGKSMNLREVFFRCASNFYSYKSSRFPVYLNLRNHIGQSSPVEALIREAANTGYDRYDDLVKAWRADLTVLILDGFDELITPVWSQRPHQLSKYRAACSKLVSEFMRESPAQTPIIVSGRSSYFNNNTEMERSLRLPIIYNTFQVNDFTKEQASAYLQKLRIHTTLPEWLPARPLLIGYLATYLMQQGITVESSTIEPGRGWDHLIDRFCQRETEIHTGLFAESVRRLLERIGTKARYRDDPTAPIPQTDISASFREIFGRDPDDSNLGMLMRLPGLVASNDAVDTRRFVDPEFANVLAAGDMFEFIIAHASSDCGPYTQCRKNITALGADFILSKLAYNNKPASMLVSALQAANIKNNLSCMKGDLLLLISLTDLKPFERWIAIDDASMENIDLGSSPPILSKIRLGDCMIEIIDVDVANFENFPSFERCMIGTIRGVADISAIRGKFTDCEVDSFEQTSLTNDAVLDLDIPNGLKVGITALRKLYVQGGSGRQESAFVRGLRPQLRVHVDAVLDILVSEGFARKSNRGVDRLFLRNPAMLGAAIDIINRKKSARHQLVQRLSTIN